MTQKSNAEDMFTNNLMYHFIALEFIFFSCKKDPDHTKNKLDSNRKSAAKNMIWVPKKTFLQGAKKGDQYAIPREKPAHLVSVNGFYIDEHEVTNEQFKTFVDETDYITVAERAIDWEEMKEQVPPGTPKPHDSILQPGSLIFNKKVKGNIELNNYNQWWEWKIGANWKHPGGPDTNINGKENHPVVHITREDAIAYCKWANRRLPTEAEWEAAALGERKNVVFTWGNNHQLVNDKINTWQGNFPVYNEAKDGYKYLAPVKSYSPNSYGIYEMLGNVWEITDDLYDVNYYKKISNMDTLFNPKGSQISYNPNNPYQKEYVIKGGSFLCHKSYCASYRISARMAMSHDSSSDHIGFRTVATNDMLNSKRSNEN